MIGWRRWAAVSTAGLGCLMLWAAAAQTDSPQRQPGTGPVATFQANANLVLVDVVVRSRNKPVEGLRQADFQVLEDGKPETVSVFEEHRTTDVQGSAKAPVLPSHVYSNFPQYRIASAANVLLLDALNTPMADQAEARAQMIEYMKTVPAGTSMAIFTLASHLQMVEGFTTNAAKLAAAMKSKGTASSQSVITEPQNSSAQMDIEQAVADVGADSDSPSPEVVGAMLQFESDLTDFQTSMRAHDPGRDGRTGAVSQRDSGGQECDMVFGVVTHYAQSR